MDRVRVLCRVRPTTTEEQTRGERVVAIQGNQRLRLQNAAEYVGEHEASWAFDAAYDTDASQAQVYESIQPITQDVLRGFHATVFAYGQTGAGKTHSMFGPPDCSLDGPDAGVVRPPRRGGAGRARPRRGRRARGPARRRQCGNQPLVQTGLV